MDLIYDQLMVDYGAVTFEAFINLLVGYYCSPERSQLISSQVDIMEDQTSPAQLRESFRGIAGDKASRLLRRRSNAMLSCPSAAICDRARSARSASSGERNRVPATSNAVGAERRRGARVRLREVARRGLRTGRPVTPPRRRTTNVLFALWKRAPCI